jgi:hypothetical protein
MQPILLAMKTTSFIRHWCVALLLVFSISVKAQLTEFAEYYWDNNPGSAVSMSLNSGGFNSAFIEAIAQSSASLSEGVHSLHVRVRGTDGNWSTPFKTMISVAQPTQVRNLEISLARYYFDNSVGSAINMVAFNGNYTKAYEQASAVAPNALSVGMHSLHVQVQGGDGSWSTPFTTMISIAEQALARNLEISMARYYFDNNLGSAINMVAFNGNYTKAYEQASAVAPNALSVGMHSLHVQVQGGDGTWSTPFTTMISIAEQALARNLEISMARYYFDNNSGSAVNMVAFNGNYTKAYEQALAVAPNALSVGMHSLHVQVQGGDGTWSTPFTTMISIAEQALARNLEISMARYYFDNNSGSAVNMVAFNGNYTKAYEQASAVATNTLSVGMHSLHVQVQGGDGTWSTPFTTMISVAEQAVARSIRIQMAEVFFDVDPGEGNATALVAFDGNFNNAFEAAFGTVSSATLTTGQHSINVRIRGEDGLWSNVFRTMVYVDPCTSSPVVEINVEGPLLLCDNDSTMVSATPGMVAYEWYRGVTLVGTNQNLWISEPGYYYVVGFDDENCPGASNGLVVTGIGTPVATITPSGPLEFCSGNSVTLNATSGFANYLWSNGQNGPSIVVNSTGDYSVTATTAGGCSSVSNTLSVQVFQGPSAPEVTINGDLSFCAGGSVQLASSYATGIQWNTGETTQSITVSQTGNYQVVYTDNEGCQSTSEIISVLVGSPNAQLAFSGDVEICEGQTLYIDPNFGGANYQWYKDGTIIQSGFDPSIGLNQTGYYWLVATDVQGCTAESDSIHLIVNPAATATISVIDGTTTFCTGGSVTLEASNGASWQWSNGATTQQVEITSSA